MNDGLIKVEICIVNGDWQWTGKLSTESLKQLCKLADKLNDADYFTNVLTIPIAKSQKRIDNKRKKLAK